MSTAIAFLSGKGGSGKTTLALSIADLLCRCGIQTLLVDCDLSTNGATYFYEAQLNEWNGNNITKVFSFCDVLNGNYSQISHPFEVKPQLDFIPSVSEISENSLTWLRKNDMEVEGNLSAFVDIAKEKYDVVLFDCQAGYSEFLPALLPKMDADLFVLEADNISASAMRSLHLKIGNHFGRARLYQIFNKATQEEFETYSKIVGTFFTNIGTLLFDWKIRQAFSRSQIPDLENTSEQYGWDLCNICKVVFREKATQGSLERFSAKMQYRKLEKKRANEERELELLLNKRNFTPRIAIMILTSVAFIAGGILIVAALAWWNAQKIDFNMITATLFMGGVSVVVSMIMTFFDGKNERQEGRKKRWEYEQKLRNIEIELSKLDKKLMESDHS